MTRPGGQWSDIVGWRWFVGWRSFVATATSAVVLAGLAVFAATPARATTPPAITAPDRVYATENSTMTFSGTDTVTSESRVISISNLTTAAPGCHDAAADNYDTDGCPRIALELPTSQAGLIDIPGVLHKVDGANVDHLVAPSGAVVVMSTDPDGKASSSYAVQGTATQLNNTLLTLQFVPTTDYREKALASDDANLPQLDIQATDGDGATNDTATTTIKVEGPNGAPSIVVHQSPLTAVVSQTADFIDDADVTDPEMCTAAICGSPYTNNTPIADPDASMVLVAWLDDNCGTFNFGGVEFVDYGSATNNDIDSLLLNSVIDDNADNGYNSDQRTAIDASLPSDALELDLTEETGTASEDTTVFAGVSDLGNVDYAVSHLEYTPPANPGTCHLNVAVSDLGNDGTPTSFNDQSNPQYEVPNALGASQQITFDIMSTHPAVTVNQTQPNGPGVDPTHTSADYTVTFDQPVDSFDSSDLDTSGSDAGLGVTCNVVPITPNLVWSITCISTHDGVIRLAVDAGEVYAEGHTGEAAYSNDASTSTDNSVTWDTTSPTVTIDQASGQADPASTSPVHFTAAFSEHVIGFTGSDVDLSASTTGGMLHAVVSGGPQTYTVAVTGMSGDGQVIASIPAGAVTDGALNPSLTSTSTDDTVAWHEVTDPTISAKVRSAHPAHHGWFATAVTISFTCHAGSAPLAGSCPKSVVLAKNTTHTSVVRTIHASDGGAATATVGPIRIDRTKPTLHVAGVKPGHRYRHVLKLRCVAHDPLSGVASCRIRQHRHGKTVHYTATAVDRAGNTTTEKGSYRLSSG